MSWVELDMDPRARACGRCRWLVWCPICTPMPSLTAVWACDTKPEAERWAHYHDAAHLWRRRRWWYRWGPAPSLGPWQRR